MLNRNVSWAADQHIRLISEGSCDTEEWSNDAENSAVIKGMNYIFKYIEIKKVHNILFFLYFDQIHGALQTIRHFLKKKKKEDQPQTLKL